MTEVRMRKCPKCGQMHERPRHSYCKPCQAAEMRRLRATRQGVPESQKEQRRARRKANRKKRRGSLVPEPCQNCGETKTEMHHPDYSQPYLVEWLCRPCHSAHHAKLRAA